jgi:hypothetical protein
MNPLLIIGCLFLLVGIVCQLILLVAAFMDEAWKRCVGLIFGLYLWYYGAVDFDHPQKWWIVGGAIGGNVLGSAIAKAGLIGHVH